MIVYVGFAQPDEWEGWAATYARHARRFEAASGELCLVVPFDRVTRELMRRLDPDAVVMSGFARSFDDYAPESFAGVTEWLLADERPTLALCGSHQLLGFLLNGELRLCDRAHVASSNRQPCLDNDDTHTPERLRDAPMRRLRADEPVTNPDYHPDFYMERGFYPLTLTPAAAAEPLFAGLGSPPYLYESHYCEIKRLPAECELLASTPECRIQAMRHKRRPLYGVQFHPEDYSERFPDGRLLPQNFFAIAGLPR